MNIAETLAATPVSDLDLSRYVTVPVSASVADTVDTMRDAARSCACVVDGGELVGIFTQRDFLQRVVGRPATWDRAIAEEMTRPVRTMREDEPVANGLTIMTDWWVRSVPVIGVDDRLVGNLSFYVIMTFIAENLVARLGVAAEPKVQHGLSFIDFTGLNTSLPVIVGPDDTVDVAAHHMRVRGIGSVLVVDEREDLVGVVTEFDLLMEIGCERSDLSAVPVRDVMTPDPISLKARAPIAHAIREIAEHGFSHVPLMGESNRPVAVTSFRDIAAYVEGSLETLG